MKILQSKNKARTICGLGIAFRKKGPDYEYLILRRTPEEGGFWQPVGGRVEPSDNSRLDGMLRELFEEAGIGKQDILRIIRNVHYFEYDRHYLTREPIRKIRTWVYAFEVKPNIRIGFDNNTNIPPEHDAFRWANYSQALKMMKWRDNRESLRKLRLILKKPRRT